LVLVSFSCSEASEPAVEEPGDMLIPESFREVARPLLSLREPSVPSLSLSTHGGEVAECGASFELDLTRDGRLRV
jgi:hypothetical protein